MDQTVHQMLHELSISDLWAMYSYMERYYPSNDTNRDLSDSIENEIESRIEVIKSKIQ